MEEEKAGVEAEEAEKIEAKGLGKKKKKAKAKESEKGGEEVADVVQEEAPASDVALRTKMEKKLNKKLKRLKMQTVGASGGDAAEELAAADEVAE